jgi:hypothetical protein
MLSNLTQAVKVTEKRHTERYAQIVKANEATAKRENAVKVTEKRHTERYAQIVKANEAV